MPRPAPTSEESAVQMCRGGAVQVMPNTMLSHLAAPQGRDPESPAASTVMGGNHQTLCAYLDSPFLTMGGNHQTPKVSRKLRESRSVTWRPATMKLSPVMARRT